MKKINIIILLIATIAFSSCEKYLDIVPKGEVILSKVEEYNSLFNDDNFLHGDYFANIPTGTTDEFWPYDETAIINNPNSVSTANFLWDESIDRVSVTLDDEFYNRAYMRISRYNIIIQEVMDSEGSETDKKEVLAKAKILRAFNHFLLVNYYANQYSTSTASETGIIVIKTFDMEQSPVQSSVQDAYDFILRDINDALPNLKDATENTLHPTKAFGYALLAKVNLFMGNYDKALENANNALDLNFYLTDLVALHEASTPAFPVPSLSVPFDSPEYLYYGGGKWGSAPSSLVGPEASSWFGTPDASGKTGDIRLDDFYVAPWWIPGAVVKLNFQRDYKHVGLGIGTPEVMLMKAECLARKGDISGSMTLVNDLRKLRILPANYTELVATNAKDAVNKVIEERSRELLNTLNRFWDIRRLADEADYAITLSKVFDGQTYTTTGKSHIFTMPFPQSVTDINKSIKQNTK